MRGMCRWRIWMVLSGCRCLGGLRDVSERGYLFCFVFSVLDGFGRAWRLVLTSLSGCHCLGTYPHLGLGWIGLTCAFVVFGKGWLSC